MLLDHEFVPGPNPGDLCHSPCEVWEVGRLVTTRCGYAPASHPDRIPATHIIVKLGGRVRLTHLDSETWAEHLFLRIDNLLQEYERAGVACSSGTPRRVT